MEEITVQQDSCYLSTSEHMRSFIGRWLYIYTDKGSLKLTSKSVTFISKKDLCEIPLNSITDISSGYYPRTAKPLPLKYVEVTYIREGKKKAIIFTPCNSWASSVWKNNKLVENWILLLNRTVPKRCLSL
jgi:hypothetical protein